MKVHKTTTLGVFLGFVSFIFIVSEEYSESTSIIYHYLQYLVGLGMLSGTIVSIKQPKIAGVISLSLFVAHFLLILQYQSVLNFLLASFCIITSGIFYILTPKDTYKY